MDCGPTCLRMIAKHYGKSFTLPFLREKCYLDRAGVSMRGISEAAETIGLRTMAVEIPFKDSKDVPSLFNAPLPAILHWNQNHFICIYKINNKFAWIADPASGKYKLRHQDLLNSWLPKNSRQGVALLLEPTNEFYKTEQDQAAKKGFSFLFQYLRPHRKLIFQLFLGLLVGTIFQLIFPFLTQSLVDIGIDTKNLNFIYVVLAGQLMLFLGQTVVQIIQSWILLHISVRINISLISDFLLKLMKLPFGFFDTKNTGDLLQRIGDHQRIERFLTQSVLSILLSIINIIVFGIVLAIYSIPIFLIFILSSIMYASWIFIFLKRRKEIDYKAFQQLSDNKDSIIEIIQGMPEIKLQGSQLKKEVEMGLHTSKIL